MRLFMKLKRSVKFIIPAVVVVLIVVAVVVHALPKKKQTNSADAAGNTAGNLMNGGLFCEYNNKIYFANPYDHNYLYVMDSDCSNARMLNSDSVASLNIYNDKIYYVKNNFSKEMIGTILRGQLFGIYQTDLEGQNSTMLYNHLTGSVSLCGNYLYYQHYESDVGITLHRMDIDGENDKLVSNTPYNPSCVSEGKIYFSNTDKKNVISTLDPKDDSISLYYDANSYLPDSEGNYVYYIDISKGYSLVRINKNTKTVELLYGKDNCKVINYNLYGSKIFFQLEGDDNPGLYRMNADGTQVEYIASGDLTNIHCTSQYTFFQYFDNQGVLYRVPTMGAISYPEEIRIQK